MNEKKNIVAIVQARIGSTRLPGKVLMDIMGKPMLWHIVSRLKYSKLINTFVIATSVNKNDDPIEEFCKKYSIDFYRGSESDLLERLYQASLMYKSDISVRVWGDCPLVDPFLIDKGINNFIKEKADYSSNFLPESTYPYGLDFEIYSSNTLRTIYLNSRKNAFFKEFPFEYIWKNKDKFNIKNLKNEEDLSRVANLTVDYLQDLKFIETIYHRLYKDDRIFAFEEVLNFLRENKELASINSGLPRNIEYNTSKKREMGNFLGLHDEA